MPPPPAPRPADTPAPRSNAAPRAFRLVAALAAAAALCNCACRDHRSARPIAPQHAPSSRGSAPATHAAPAAHARLRARTTQSFALALFGKPADAIDKQAHALAPLFALEVATADQPADLVPQVHFERSRTRLAEREREQIAYYWHFTDVGASGQTTGGVRLTLGADGRPIIAELLAPIDGLSVMYVAESLERAAAAAFGGPLPGRQFAVERSVAECADVVVARLLVDGPVPMGPWIYLAADGVVTTLLCRCSPSQVGENPAGFSYELLPGAAADMPDGRGWRDEQALQRVLRLPPTLP